MARNEYGERLDANGYAPTLLSDDFCLLCGWKGQLIRHEAFGGSRRQLSKALGLWTNLCVGCHERCHARPDEAGKYVKVNAQNAAMEHYGWTKEEFIKRFGRSYI